MKRIFLFFLFYVTCIYAHAYQETHVKERSFSAGITIGLGPASIHGLGNPYFDIDQLKQKRKSSGNHSSLIEGGGLTSGEVGSVGCALCGGVYFAYAFSNYISGEIQMNYISKSILMTYKGNTFFSMRLYAIPSIYLYSKGLSFPLLGSFYPFGNQKGLKLFAGIALDFPTLCKRFMQYGMAKEWYEGKEVAYTAFKKQLRNWDMAMVIGIGYEWCAGWILDIRYNRGFLGLLKENYLADKLFKDSDITGIKNIKNRYTTFTIGYNILRLFKV
ncbi:hypothetical protein [Candidatus Cardinium hertigii]|uniref:Outer membrane protein beta-barrel domain-containing protein n=1 Tax=Candidatus Cardinium hertigii TaxID=247481 RepID=A0A2Z3LG76_9BACT|nr:hypothetical protein [Candidatus Cardinium hertigii]AWN81384.1 hypothetical protein DK880_00046 [Candidatus Cardinium hertigii]